MRYQQAQIAIRGRHHPDVHLARGGRAYALHLLILQDAQELGLRRQRQFADFVQEQRAAAGKFEEAGAILRGSGERSLDVAEQLAFEQRLDNRGGIADDKGPVPHGLSRCSAFATSSLPVPVSPVISTVLKCGATRRMRA